MNMSLFQDKTFNLSLNKDLKKKIVNIGSTDKLSTVWEASKAYVKGKIIAHTSRKKREDRERVEKLVSN